ncbi:nodal-related 2 [Synchiropus splendidus]|uniref:nodal-related 2 n=1 Tax=Synchiropus splendidus TaxID=270530 RepID=UPI00237EE1AA|nr:nodal-related 2 [Synchiropus splendidus]
MRGTALGVLLRASLLALLVDGSKDGVYVKSLQRVSLMDRPSGYHLPTYMMQLYKNFKSNFSRVVDALEMDAEMEADTVRSVMARGLVYRQRRWLVTFDLQALLTDQQIQAAELRIRVPVAPGASNISVLVYHQHGPVCLSPKRCPKQQLVGLLTESSMVTSSHKWRVFNITAPLLKWLRESSMTQHESTSRRRSKKRGPSPPNQPVHVASARKEKEAGEKALLVIFSNTGADQSSKAKASLLHTAEQSKFLSPAEIKKSRWPKRRRSKRGQREQTARSPQVSRRVGEKNLCRKVDLHVDFNQIGWGSWIIFPKKYNAYRCEGTCPGPLGEDLNPTNHAYMQSLLKHYHPDKVVAPCCAPTKTSPLSMLYYENGEMLLRHHEDMIVDECGCQ